MPNPYGPRWPREPRTARTMRDVLPTLDQFVERLRLLGASPSTIDVVRERWEPTDDADREDRDQVLLLCDDDLRALILEVEEEHRISTTTEEEEAAARFTAKVEQLNDYAADADEWVKGNVQSVLDVVGDDPVAAAAALLAETTRADEAGEDARVTLVEPLQARAGDEWVAVVGALDAIATALKDDDEDAANAALADVQAVLAPTDDEPPADAS